MKEGKSRKSTVEGLGGEEKGRNSFERWKHIARIS